jgi:hypothetical protein
MSGTQRDLLLFWLVIQLLLGQQIALAHMVGHLGEMTHAGSPIASAMAADDDEERTAAHSLSHVCTTCVAGLGLDVVLADTAIRGAATIEWALMAFAAVLPAPTFYRPRPFLSRGPPAFQS